MFRIGLLFVTLFVSTSAYGKQGDIYSRDCESNKKKFCAYSVILSDEKVAEKDLDTTDLPDSREVLVKWQESSTDKELRTYHITCNSMSPEAKDMAFTEGAINPKYMYEKKLYKPKHRDQINLWYATCNGELNKIPAKTTR